MCNVKEHNKALQTELRTVPAEVLVEPNKCNVLHSKKALQALPQDQVVPVLPEADLTVKIFAENFISARNMNNK